MEVRRESSWPDELAKPEPLRWMRPEVPVDGPEPDGARALADMGVLSMDELLLVLSLLPFAIGVDAFLGVEEPNPTGVCLKEESLPPPDLMLEDLLTLLPPRGSESESRET